MAYGTYSINDLLANQNTIAAIGEDNVWQSLQMAIEVYNARVREAMGELVTVTTDQQQRYGGYDEVVMDKMDEFGRPSAQKVTAGVNVGFPLDLYGTTVQWTRKYMENATVADLARRSLGAMAADFRNVHRQIKQAVFSPTNVTVVDRLVNNAINLDLKALVNADSAAIPLGPDGTSFNGATHTHYLGTAALAAADIDSLINTVTEHYSTGQARLYINRAQEAAVRGFTAAGQFVAMQPVQIIPATSTTVARGPLETSQTYNRMIGLWGNQAAEVWIKPWVPANYMFAFMVGPSKPLRMRVRRDGAGNFGVDAEDEKYPLRAQTLTREFGIAVRERTNGAALLTNNATYSAPAFPITG